MVIAAIVKGGRTRLLVAPITHAAPERQTDAIEIPLNVRKRLGLDGARSWIVLTELNRFIWPGPDIRLAPGHESPFYDAIPDWLFFHVRERVVARWNAGKIAITKRTD